MYQAKLSKFLRLIFSRAVFLPADVPKRLHCRAQATDRFPQDSAGFGNGVLNSPESAGNTFSLLKPLLRVNAQASQIMLSFHRWTRKGQCWKLKPAQLELGNSCLGREKGGVISCGKVASVRWGSASDQVCVLKGDDNYLFIKKDALVSIWASMPS